MEECSMSQATLMTLIYREPTTERDASITIQVLSPASDTAVHMYERGRDGKREREILGGGWGNGGGREREYSQSQSSDEGSHTWTEETHCVLKDQETLEISMKEERR